MVEMGLKPYKKKCPVFDRKSSYTFSGHKSDVTNVRNIAIFRMFVTSDLCPENVWKMSRKYLENVLYMEIIQYRILHTVINTIFYIYFIENNIKYFIYIYI